MALARRVARTGAVAAMAFALAPTASATDYVCAKYTAGSHSETVTITVDDGSGPPGHPYFNCSIVSSSSSPGPSSSGPDYSRFWEWYEPASQRAGELESAFMGAREEALQLQQVGEASRRLAWLPELAEDWERAAELAAQSAEFADRAAAELGSLRAGIPDHAAYVGKDAGKELASAERRLEAARYAARSMRELAAVAAAKAGTGGRASREPWGAEADELVAVSQRIAAAAPSTPDPDVLLYAAMVRRSRWAAMREAAPDLAKNPWVYAITANQLAQSDGLRDVALANRLLRQIEPELGEQAPAYFELLPAMTRRGVWFGRILPVTGEADAWRGTAVGVEIGTRRVAGTVSWTRDRWLFDRPADVFAPGAETGVADPESGGLTVFRLADFDSVDVAFPRLEVGVAVDLIAAPLWWPVRPVFEPAVAGGLGLGRVKGTLDGHEYKVGTGGWCVSYGGRVGVDVRALNLLLAARANVHDARVFSEDGIWADPAMNGWRAVVTLGVTQVTTKYRKGSP